MADIKVLYLNTFQGSQEVASTAFDPVNVPTENQKAVLAATSIVEGKIRIGGESNYMEIDADGTLNFVGTSTTWEDENIGALTLKSPANSPDLVEIIDQNGVGTGIHTYGFAIGEEGSGFLEEPHRAKSSADGQFHIHIHGNDAPTGTDKIKFEIDYIETLENDLIPEMSTISVEVDYDTQYKRITMDFPYITINPFIQFGFTLRRVAASANDYAGDVLLHTVGIHYEIARTGSKNITSN